MNILGVILIEISCSWLIHYIAMVTFIEVGTPACAWHPFVRDPGLWRTGKLSSGASINSLFSVLD